MSYSTIREHQTGFNNISTEQIIILILPAKLIFDSELIIIFHFLRVHLIIHCNTGNYL